MNEQYKSVPEMLRALGDKDTAAWLEAKQPEKEPLIECICKLAKRLDAVTTALESIYTTCDEMLGSRPLTAIGVERVATQKHMARNLLKTVKGESDD